MRGPPPHTRTARGASLAQARIKLGLRQRDLDRAAGVTSLTVSKLENHRWDLLPSGDLLLDKAARVGAVVGIGPWEIVGPDQVWPDLEPEQIDPERYLFHRGLQVRDAYEEAAKADLIPFFRGVCERILKPRQVEIVLSPYSLSRQARTVGLSRARITQIYQIALRRLKRWGDRHPEHGE